MDSSLAAARFARLSSTEKGGNPQKNALWMKLAKRFTVGLEEDEEEEENKLREQCRLYRHGQQVNDLNFHPDLPIFASCSEDRTVKIWEQNPVSDFTIIWVLCNVRVEQQSVLEPDTFWGCDRTLSTTMYGRARILSRATLRPCRV
jgi:WD40 repeat protein